MKFLQTNVNTARKKHQLSQLLRQNSPKHAAAPCSTEVKQGAAVFINGLSAFYKVVAGHFGRLRHTEYVEYRRGHVGKYAVGGRGVLVGCHIHKRHGIERVSRVGCSVGVGCVVGVTVVSYDNHLVTVSLCREFPQPSEWQDICRCVPPCRRWHSLQR